jgi:flagellar FliL protein
MRLILPVILSVVGMGAGVGAGFALRPEAPAEETAASEASAAAPVECASPLMPVAAGTPGPAGPSEFVRLGNQFVIPVLGDKKIAAMVMLSFSLEVGDGPLKDAALEREPKIRDAFLSVLFDHSNAGGFDGNFINPEALDDLRRALLETARGQLGPGVRDVLITDLLRQAT